MREREGIKDFFNNQFAVFYGKPQCTHPNDQSCAVDLLDNIRAKDISCIIHKAGLIEWNHERLQNRPSSLVLQILTIFHLFRLQKGSIEKKGNPI